jgi:hypothetical protein
MAKKNKHAAPAARMAKTGRGTAEDAYEKIKRSAIYMALMMASIFVFYVLYTELAPAVAGFLSGP